jgi:Golgi SNAP receptor complex protein 2
MTLLLLCKLQVDKAVGLQYSDSILAIQIWSATRDIKDDFYRRGKLTIKANRWCAEIGGRTEITLKMLLTDGFNSFVFALVSIDCLLAS